ncbi:lipoprotein-releasing system transmembrane subunit, LolC/LolE family [Saccharobesus litoralis]|uniref:Lipoprotein-releasing system transmembrane subunit, LolC/LolE family n=1 Tax=Saccharobesus litoralis TaxID=2172099 RepID=A0A2S0VTA8_9ALTE|nr:lipoprotein-releasing ABC transporter permease subunit [Saccharobesus litoralis]AWB67444.1 lipoprotein-releasing system transmembrane subunit, LolC/LolE family [Saccharobesus litoralis]
MFNSLSLFIASRYSRSKQRNSFISFITFFSIAGITLGVMALIIVVSVMNGFESELKKRVLGVVPHIVLTNNAEQTDTDQDFSAIESALLNLSPVVGVTPFIQTQGMVQSPTDMRAIMVQGINPIIEKRYSVINDAMQTGQLEKLTPKSYQVIIGRQLASQLSVGVGEQVRLMLVERTRYTPMGRLPVQRKFTVAGIFDVGSDVDAHIALVNYTDVARMLGHHKQDVQSGRVYLSDAFQYKSVVDYLAQRFPNWQSLDWRQSQGKLFDAVRMEKNMMWLMLCLIIAVAAFNIVSALVMVVSEKQGEIAMLKTMGLASNKIQLIFILQGLYKGCFGGVLGTILGVLAAANLNSILTLFGGGLLAAPGYSASGLPVDIQVSQVIIIAIASVLMSFLATIYPSYRAAHTQPADILRYE